MAKAQSLNVINLDDFKSKLKSEVKIGDRLLNTAEVCDKIGKSRTLFWKIRKKGGFPKEYYLGSYPQWLESEVDAWIQAQRNKV